MSILLSKMNSESSAGWCLQVTASGYFELCVIEISTAEDGSDFVCGREFTDRPQ